MNNIEDPNIRKTLFTGTAFVTFKNQEEYDKYLAHYPNSAAAKFFRVIELFFANYVLCCLYSKARKDYLKKSWSFTAAPAPEPSDIIWENLEYTRKQRLIRKVWVYITSLALMLVSFGIVVIFNNLQVKIY
jgi:hypothetical protein